MRCKMSTRIWYNKYNTGYDNINNQWMRAVPLGNGRVAAMLYGNTDTEIIQINEESLWSGRQVEEKFSADENTLPTIRALLAEGKFREAAAFCAKTLMASPLSVRQYQTFGDVLVDFSDKAPAEDYMKELELSTAIATMSYKKNSTSYKTETFVSSRYDALVHRIDATSPFGCRVTMKREKDAFTTTVDERTLLMKGQIHYTPSPRYGEGGEGLSFGARFYFDTDGKLACEDTAIVVTNATYLTVYGAFATNYNVEKYDVDETKSYRARLDEIINGIKNLPYEQVKREHIEDYQELFNRVKFEIKDEVNVETKRHEGGSTYVQGFSLSDPTDLRVEKLRYHAVDDPDFYTLYYNFGRYLLISGSGPRATLPTNLQGKWCGDLYPTWGSDYHVNINMQMNYWPCESANLSETFNPVIHMMKMLSKFGVRTAKELFGASGWVHMHTTDIFGKTGTHDNADCGFFPVAGPWNCLNLFEHYEYSGDENYLREIYPIMMGSCEFFNDFLIEKDGYLITSPSNSPENMYYYIHPETGERLRTMICEGATMDFEIIRSLFVRTLWTAKRFGEDEKKIAMIENVLAKLPPLRVSQYGTVAEWMDDNEEVEPGHRHISQLFALFPDNDINETKPEIFEAARKTMERRLSHGGGGTGWSIAWFVNFYARLRDGEGAISCLDKLIKNFTYYNLFDLHPPYPLFQIDGNFGGTSGIVEMLLQSHVGEIGEKIIEILPALPKKWNKGSISGLRARGNFTVDIEWDKAAATRVRILAVNGGVVRVKESDTMRLTPNKAHTVENGVITISVEKGEVVEFN